MKTMQKEQQPQTRTHTLQQIHKTQQKTQLHSMGHTHEQPASMARCRHAEDFRVLLLKRINAESAITDRQMWNLLQGLDKLA